ncbi:BTAD domain-containing putative transcriptional regulator [Plantactinospora sp. CA-294935]|uniref:BTAD domain-containing putative transcriptional regulator n=1 Tax=Plantactinospora sp. CA-294935 TaxID=3240012 RepID=UPI003D8C5C0A
MSEELAKARTGPRTAPGRPARQPRRADLRRCRGSRCRPGSIPWCRDRCSRAGDHAAALSHADAGLALWGGAGPGPADDADSPVSALRAERRATYRTLVRARALALARLDRAAEAVDRLAELAGDRPRDEEVLIELLRCEAATAGPATALARYDAYRRALRDELGTDPGAALQAEHRRLLQGVVPTVQRGIVHEPNPLLGRDDDVAAVEALLRTSRVTSIVGPGGLGKTRLANVVARRAEVLTVTVVPLAGIVADDDVVREVAAAVRRRPSARPRWCRSAMSSRFSSPVRKLSSAENWPVTPIAARTRSGSRTTS